VFNFRQDSEVYSLLSNNSLHELMFFSSLHGPPKLYGHNVGSIQNL